MADKDEGQVKTKRRLPKPGEALGQGADKLREGQLWKALFRPGSIFRKGYQDSPRNRAYVVMNSVLYHLHPVKVKRHGIKLSYTLCLGGLSFFLFIFLTVTGIFLMFFYRPSAEPPTVYTDMLDIQANVAFGQLVRNLHRWSAHLMVITVMLHMARVFYTGAYKPPREFNWILGVTLWLVTLLLAFTGYLLPWDQVSIWAVTVGTQMISESPVVGKEVQFVLLGGNVIGAPTLIRWYTLHVLLLPFIIVIQMGIHFWRVRKDGGISGPL